MVTLREVCRPGRRAAWDEDPAKPSSCTSAASPTLGAARAIWLHSGLRHLDEFERRGQC